jgi:Enoyl-(Acyl carrier protein) reductase
MGRLGQPEDIARVAVFLASDNARWLTGERITVSGGLRQGPVDERDLPLTCAGAAVRGAARKRRVRGRSASPAAATALARGCAAFATLSRTRRTRSGSAAADAAPRGTGMDRETMAANRLAGRREGRTRWRPACNPRASSGNRARRSRPAAAVPGVPPSAVRSA